MRFLLDTCVISEMVRQNPSRKVVDWIKNEDENSFFISVLTFGELHKGIEKLDKSKRKEALHNWVENDLKERFVNRTINIDLRVALLWGKIQGIAEKSGRSMPAIDSLIAATGLAHHLTVATRNTADMEASGVSLFNPWQEKTT
ncbi:MAG: type II toxin-antitoxin system VapC family toxin [Syntrophaceae bacterium]|nr:type II toxin-antitoxin system VapC family toxin [Syntrophaceae bacterium]